MRVGAATAALAPRRRRTGTTCRLGPHAGWARTPIGPHARTPVGARTRIGPDRVPAARDAQAITGPEERQKLFREFSPGFFDLIVIDECHRGSAADDSAWREILDYFTTATQIGLTATPKETEYVSNIHYFGDPVYTYSLKEGIADGFLAPYKVVKPELSIDADDYRPQKGEKDKYGNVIEDRVYNQKDFDRRIVIESRTQAVARKVTAFLQFMDADRSASLLIAATNHAELLDRAIFRRFDVVLSFELPSQDAVAQLLALRLPRQRLSEQFLRSLAARATGLSFADAARACDDAIRTMVLSGETQLREETLAASLDAMVRRTEEQPRLRG